MRRMIPVIGLGLLMATGCIAYVPFDKSGTTRKGARSSSGTGKSGRPVRPPLLPVDEKGRAEIAEIPLRVAPADFCPPLASRATVG
jgi:hypothetical protein